MSDIQKTISEFAYEESKATDTSDAAGEREPTESYVNEYSQYSLVTPDKKDIEPEDINLTHPLAQRWSAARQNSNNISENTAPNYESSIRSYLLFLDEIDTKLLDARTEELYRYIEFRIKIGMSQNTVQNDYGVIKDLYLFIRNRTSHEPSIEHYQFDVINLDRYNYEGGFTRDALSRGELIKLFQNFDERRNLLMTYLATATGIRNSDVRSLELSDINHDEELIEISDSKFGDSYKAAMTSELSLQLKQWKNHGRQGLRIEESNEYVFPSKHGGKLETNQSFNKKVKAAAERAEIQDVIGRCRVTGGQQYMNSKYRKVHRVTVHTLRHTFVTMLKKLKVPGDIRALAANHDNLRSLQRYEHYYEEEYDLIRSVLSSDRIPRI